MPTFLSNMMTASRRSAPFPHAVPPGGSIQRGVGATFSSHPLEYLASASPGVQPSLLKPGLTLRIRLVKFLFGNRMRAEGAPYGTPYHEEAAP